jgi:hypothetical protein
MFALLAIETWFTDIKTFVNEDISSLAFTAIIVALSVVLLATFRYIVKYAYNVNVVKKNLAMPILLAVLSAALLIFLCSIRIV